MLSATVHMRGLVMALVVLIWAMALAALPAGLVLLFGELAGR